MGKSVDDTKLALCANTVRVLSAEAIEKANSGHPGMPLGCADFATALFLNYLNYNPQQPNWLNRDRLVLSNGHGSMLLYSLLHLAGYQVSIDDIKSFRQLGSKTPGHPEFGLTPGVECTTGPLGQGIANAVGMALAQKMLASRYNTQDTQIFDSRVFCVLGDGCLMEGISYEACSLAGHLGLGNLIAIYDDNEITIAGKTGLSFSEDVSLRFKAMGWQVLKIDGHDFEQIDKAIKKAVSEKKRPSIICARTVIGKGAPTKANTSHCHGSPLGNEEIQGLKNTLGFDASQSFQVPSEVYEIFSSRRERLERVYKKWQKQFARWSKSQPELVKELNKQLSGRPNEESFRDLMEWAKQNDKDCATRKHSETVLQYMATEYPALVGGSADLEPSCLTVIKNSASVRADSFAGRNIHFGIREHAMAGIMNGLAYTLCFIPFGSTFLSFADYMRPSIRLSAIAGIQSVFIFTHDSIFVGEDGPTHQPVEQLASLRLIPNLRVFRPADVFETALAYHSAVARADGPTALVLSRQNLPVLTRKNDFKFEDMLNGAYVLFENESVNKELGLVLLASGSEVSLAMKVAGELSSEFRVRVVSVPCLELFRAQTPEFKENLLAGSTPKFVIEAGIRAIWADLLSECSASVASSGVSYVTIDEFGHCGPASKVADKMGFTLDAVLAKVRKSLS